MARVNRSDVIHPNEIQLLHCVNRCVRRGFLCGNDDHSGRNYDHRRLWIRRRLEFLAGIFGVDVLSFAVLSNHFHVVVRTRPDVVAKWSDEETAQRWWNLFPQRRNEDGSAADPTDAELRSIYGDAQTLAERRKRLSCVSWFMRCMCEVIARMANAEDGCTGRFWEGRFRTTVLDSEEALAACMAYVDLNPIRAGLADTPECSDFTSVKERITDLQSADAVDSADAKDARTEHGERAGWLSPVPLEPKRRKVRSKKTERRTDNKGCHPMSLPEYLQLVEWTGRKIHDGKRGRINDAVPSILDRLGTTAEIWMDVVRKQRRRQNIPLNSTQRSRGRTGTRPVSSTGA